MRSRFSLYSNQGIVQALKAFKGKTNLESCEVTENSNVKLRTNYVYEVQPKKRLVDARQEGHDAFRWSNIGKVKSSSPYGIKIYKGSSFIAGSREFCRYASYAEPARALLEWLNDTVFADE